MACDNHSVLSRHSSASLDVGFASLVRLVEFNSPHQVPVVGMRVRVRVRICRTGFTTHEPQGEGEGEGEVVTMISGLTPAPER